jgi:hypothetical protein
MGPKVEDGLSVQAFATDSWENVGAGPEAL